MKRRPSALSGNGKKHAGRTGYSDMNVRDTSLREALRSPLFRALQNGGLLEDDHAGGCVLYEKRAQVEALLNK